MWSVGSRAPFPNFLPPVAFLSHHLGPDSPTRARKCMANVDSCSHLNSTVLGPSAMGLFGQSCKPSNGSAAYSVLCTFIVLRFLPKSRSIIRHTCGDLPLLRSYASPNTRHALRHSVNDLPSKPAEIFGLMGHCLRARTEAFLTWGLYYFTPSHPR